MLRKIGQYARQWLGITSAENEPATPEAILERQKEVFREQLADYNHGLAASAALCELLKGQIALLERQEYSLRAALGSQTASSETSKRGSTAEPRLQKLLGELSDLRGQLKDSESTCNELVLARNAAIAAARTKFAELKDFLGETQVERALAEVLGAQEKGRHRSSS